MSVVRAAPRSAVDPAPPQISFSEEGSAQEEDGPTLGKAPLYSTDLSEVTTTSSASSSAASVAADDDEQGGSPAAASQKQKQQAQQLQQPLRQPSSRLSLPPPSGLDGIKSRRRAVFSVQANSMGDGNSSASCSATIQEVGMLPANCAKCQGSSLYLGLGARTALVGLSRPCLDSLLAAFSDGLPNTHSSEGLTAARLHAGLHVAALDLSTEDACSSSSSSALPSLEAQVAALAEQSPQLLCLDITTLRRPGVCSMLKSFSGAVLVLFQGGPQSSKEAQDEDPWDMDISLLRAIGVTSRYVLSSAGGKFEAPSPALPALPSTEILSDLKLKDLEEDPDLKALVDQAQPWYDHYFHDDLIEEVRCWGAESRVAFLVCSHSGHQKNDETPPKWRFLGLIIYKLWGPPLRSMSILRVVVPGEYRLQGYGRVLMRWVIEKARGMSRSICSRLTLCSLPEAIPFYERLQFTPIPQDDPEDAPPPDPELPQPMPGSLWMQLKCGRVTKTGGRR